MVDNHRMDDMRPYLWKTADYGKTWKSLAAGLARGRLPARGARGPEDAGAAVRGDRARASSFSRDDGATWKELKLNLPTVAVHDLVVKDDDLVVGTHGRSIWILDDLTALREWSGAIEASAVHLFAPASGRALAARAARLVARQGPGREPAGGRRPSTTG